MKYCRDLIIALVATAGCSSIIQHPLVVDAAAATSSSSDEQSCPSSSSSSSCINNNNPSQQTSGSYYCLDTSKNSEYNLLGNLDCFHHRNETPGNYVTPHLRPGQITPILWHDGPHDGKMVSQYVFQIGLPPQLVPTILDYCNSLGITSLMQKFTSTDPIPAIETDHNGKFVTLSDGNIWYAQRPEKRWNSNMHWISPSNERSHEDFLRTLGRGGFDEVLAAIGEALELDGLAAYQLTFIGVSKSVVGYTHQDTTGTDGRVYSVIVPLLLEEDVPPELILEDDITEERGGYKYQVGVAALMGDDAMHGTRECDYTKDRDGDNVWKNGGILENGKRIGMRLAAVVYIADINDDNVGNVADETMTQIFPMEDAEWLRTQMGRHWQAAEGGASMRKNRLVGDKGRRMFSFDDDLEDCRDLARRGECVPDKYIPRMEWEGTTRMDCLKSCGVYIHDGPTKTKKLEDTTNSKFHVCTQNRTGMEECRVYDDTTDIAGDVAVPKLEPGEVFPIVWRQDGSQTMPYGFQVGIPPELTTELLNYCRELGMLDKFRDLLGDDPIESNNDDRNEPSNGQIVQLTDGNRWYAQRLETKWTTNMHSISPADEKTHEEYLKVLSKGNFDVVLDAIGKYLGLEGLAAYQLTFNAVSHSEKGFIQRDTHSTGASVYNVIIPLILDNESSPELELVDYYDKNRSGSLKYQIGTAILMGDFAMHTMQAYDHRKNKGSMRMMATISIADINPKNAKLITEQHTPSTTQIFPLADDKIWLLAQSGRHWGDGKSLAQDKGRKRFSFSDNLINCKERAEEGKCESDLFVTRKECLKSCNIYEMYESADELEYTFDPEEDEDEDNYDEDEDEDNYDDEDEGEDNYDDEDEDEDNYDDEDEGEGEDNYDDEDEDDDNMYTDDDDEEEDDDDDMYTDDDDDMYTDDDDNYDEDEGAANYDDDDDED